MHLSCSDWSRERNLNSPNATRLPARRHAMPPARSRHLTPPRRKLAHAQSLIPTRIARKDALMKTITVDGGAPSADFAAELD